jgi:hypothetical protein
MKYWSVHPFVVDTNLTRPESSVWFNLDSCGDCKWKHRIGS